jgi:outer membrane protein assembly factor BamB
MNKHSITILIVGLCYAAFSCVGSGKPPLVDPVKLAFPLAEAGTLDIEGAVVGQPRAQEGIVYYATSDGVLTAVVPSAGSILWRFKADNPFTAGPELGEGHIVIRDAANTLYVLDAKGAIVIKKSHDETITTAVRENEGQLFFGTSNGKIVALDEAAGGAAAWEYRADAAVTAGPVFTGNIVLFGIEDGRLLAFNRAGQIVWKFAAEGAIAKDPGAGKGRLYFGTESRYFYCLDAATGKKKWFRRLQGAPLHPALVSGHRVAVAASNSTVYFLSGRGGSILSWQAIPSRIVYEPDAAGPALLVSSATESLSVFDLKTAKRLGQHLTSRPQAAGALWVSPFVVLFEEGPDPGRQTIAFLRSR